MKSTNDSGIPMLDSFFEQWVPELARAVELFIGVKPELSCTKATCTEQSELDRLHDYLWWRNVFVAESGFNVWIGAPEGAWTAFTTEEGSKDEARELYLKVLAHTQQAAAAALSKRFGKSIRCEADGEAHPSSNDGLFVSVINVCLHEAALPPLIGVIEATAANLLRRNGEKEGESGLNRVEQRSAEIVTPMLDRLMELELPLSVALGRATMPIRDVLKLTSGSLIELDRDAGAYVDLLVHGTVVARGEVVSVKGNYGVRIREIISRQDRIALQDECKS